jgi:hypothetical protein
VEEIRNRFKGGGRSSRPSSCEAPSSSRRLRVRGGDDELSVGEPVGQLLMSIALGKIELLELISEAL